MIAQDENPSFARPSSQMRQRRSMIAIEVCREELQNLRKAVKNARSHREKSSQLYSLATDAVLEMEEVVEWATSTEGISPELERAIAKSITRLGALIDECETLVKIYGNMSGFDKLFKSSSDVGLRYEEASGKIRALSERLRFLQTSGVSRDSNSARGSSVGNSGSRQPSGFPGSLGTATAASSDMTSSYSDPMVLTSAEAELRTGSGDQHVQQVSDGEKQNNATLTQSHSQSSSDHIVDARFSGISDGGDKKGNAVELRQPQLEQKNSQREGNIRQELSHLPNNKYSIKSSAFGSGAPSSAGASIAGTVSGIPAFSKRAQKLKRSSKIESISALLYLPSQSREETFGTSWYYVSRLFSADKFSVLDLSSMVHTDISPGRSESAITVLHADHRGLIWSGHRSGSVM